MLLSLTPAVLALLRFSPALYPACLLPIAAVYQGSRVAARSEHQANHDALTGLANRPRLLGLMERAVDEEQRFAVLLMDLNRFKEINDTLGHHHGDLLLRQVAERLVAAVRPCDRVARLGGDEFVVLVTGLSQDEASREAEQVAERITAGLSAPCDLDGLALEVDASIGIAVHPAHGADPHSLLRHADIAMYYAKRAHLPHATYSAADDHHTPERLALAADLRRAIGADELRPWYQPQVDLATGRVAAVEALARWQHPSLGLLEPAAFSTSRRPRA